MLFAFLTWLYFTLETIHREVEILTSIYIVTLFFISALSILYYGFGLSSDPYMKDEWKKVTKEEHLTINKFLKHSFLNKILFPKTIITVIILTAMFPSEKTLKYMAGAYVTQESYEYVMSSDEAKQLPDNVLKAANSFLKDISAIDIEEIKGSVKEEVSELKDKLVSETKELTKEQKEKLIKELESTIQEQKDE